MTRLLPSMLFVPGGDARKLAKVPDLRAPAVILDLEDAVADAAKAGAREAVAAALDAPGGTPDRYVRINTATAVAAYDDLRAVVRPGLTGVVLPKVGSARDVHVADWAITALEAARGLPAGGITLMPTIETVAGLASVDAIATASPRTQCLIFGAGDFSLDAGLDWPAEGGASTLLVEAKCALVRASRLAGLQPPHDGVYPRFRDEAGLVREARASLALGMFGKHAIHPDQVAPIVTVFTPTPEQVRRARETLGRFTASEAGGVANLDVDGMFVDYPVAARARQLLDLATGLDGAGLDGAGSDGVGSDGAGFDGVDLDGPRTEGARR